MSFFQASILQPRERSTTSTSEYTTASAIILNLPNTFIWDIPLFCLETRVCAIVKKVLHFYFGSKHNTHATASFPKMDQRELKTHVDALQKAVASQEPAANILTLLVKLKNDVTATEELLRVCPLSTFHGVAANSYFQALTFVAGHKSRHGCRETARKLE